MWKQTATLAANEHHSQNIIAQSIFHRLSFVLMVDIDNLDYHILSLNSSRNQVYESTVDLR